MERIFECRQCGDGIIVCTLKVKGNFNNTEPPSICPYDIGIICSSNFKPIRDCSNCFFYCREYLGNGFVSTKCGIGGSSKPFEDKCPEHKFESEYME